MMKRFSRRRRGAGGGEGTATIDPGEWLPKITEQGIVEAKSLDAWTDAGVPDRVAALGRGERADGSALIVSFSPTSATDAMVGGLAAAQKLADASGFTGELLVVAPQWPAGARRILGLLGRTPYTVEPVAAPGLTAGRVVVEAEPAPRILASNPSQLASRLSVSEARSAFSRAAAALEGLAAKHGGCVRVGIDRLELVVLARRVAEIRVEDDAAVLEVQIGGRSRTPLSGADLAGALDGLEGQLRRRLNDRKVREGEEGLRGRVIAQLSEGNELRGLRAWPQPGTDQDAVDGVGVDAAGQPVVVAVRQAFDWRALGGVLESLGPVESLLPVLFTDVAPPLRLGTPRLLLTAERFEDGLEHALGALTLAYELRVVSEAVGAGIDLAPQARGEGAESRPARGRRRRGGRGRSGEDERPSSSGGAETAGASAIADEPDDEDASEEKTTEARSGGDDDEGGRGRGRRRRRGRRGGRPSGGDGAEAADPPAREAREAREVREKDEGGGDGGRRKRRFEEVSLMDLDDGPGDDEEGDSRSSESGGGDGRRRGRRRGRRSGSDRAENGGRAKADATASEDAATSDDDEPATEEDWVDADDLSEILARLPDDVPEFPESGSADYDEEDDDDDDGASTSGARGGRRGGSRSDASGDDDRPAPRKRSAILVHADPDSLMAAVLLARDIRQLEGLWIYPQDELMTFFRSIATDLRDDTPIFVIGFSPRPAHDVLQAASLYRGRLTWFDRGSWPPEDLAAMKDALGADAVFGGEGLDSTLPLVLETCSRRSRFSDKLVDLVTGRFTQHDFERWGRLWRHRASEIAGKHGDIRGDVAALLAGRPSDLAKEAAMVAIPPPPPEVGWVAERDFRLVHFGGHVLVVLELDPGLDVHLASRVARERYDASLSLARTRGEEVFVFAGDETTGKRALDYMAIAEHLSTKLEWVDARPDADHVSRFRIRDVERKPDRLEEVIGEIAMGRSLLER